MSFLNTLFLLCISVLIGIAIGMSMPREIPSPVQACQSLVEPLADGMYDPTTGLIFIKTADKTPQEVINISAHEFAHFYRWYMNQDLNSESYAQTMEQCLILVK